MFEEKEIKVSIDKKNECNKSNETLLGVLSNHKVLFYGVSSLTLTFTVSLLVVSILLKRTDYTISFGEIGDFLGGISSVPLVLMGNILVFYTLKKQIETNEEQFKRVSKIEERENESLNRAELKDYYDDIKEYVNDFSYNGKEGVIALNDFFKEDVDVIIKEKDLLLDVINIATAINTFYKFYYDWKFNNKDYKNNEIFKKGFCEKTEDEGIKVSRLLCNVDKLYIQKIFKKIKKEKREKIKEEKNDYLEDLYTFIEKNEIKDLKDVLSI